MILHQIFLWRRIAHRPYCPRKLGRRRSRRISPSQISYNSQISCSSLDLQQILEVSSNPVDKHISDLIDFIRSHTFHQISYSSNRCQVKLEFSCKLAGKLSSDLMQLHQISCNFIRSHEVTSKSHAVQADLIRIYWCY